ncbi:FUSC family protein [Flavilitoribacter nigricans]|uniref:Integral membrane bound transporter domain-containing protein n=1 Tax=Flavilitoribacter nigricans (strain ATCC 23147 / DSM 23189 / NBRC 102662 / NCIMB 1420 / SS-2) TaxID=1122177 RepID=A0A2D0MZM2_FLAN2|nr:FUSC family protein [Flavilitoribacter nigricans]PHN01620.1 hypothetical protein CRP01_35970 [Flavilitoribacter nigricans DSM 23189 = NBRC 102662]
MYRKIFENSRILLRAAILTGIILSSFFLGFSLAALLQMSDRIISGVWCSIAAVVVFDDLLENAKTLMKDRLLGTFTGALLTAAFSALLQPILIAIALALLAVCILIIYFEWKGALKIACITVLIIGISPIQGINGGIWSAAFMRFIESALGGFVAIGATVVQDKVKSFQPLRSWQLQVYRTYLRMRR